MKHLLIIPAILLALCSFAGNRNFTIHVANTPVALSQNGRTAVSQTTRTQLLQNAKLVSDDSTIPILGYSVSIVPKRHDPRGPFTVKGSTFTQEVIDAITQTSGSTTIYIESIKVKGPDGWTRNAPSITIECTQ
ncbi:MAG: GldM family protein [Bacteroidota bacterium]